VILVADDLTDPVPAEVSCGGLVVGGHLRAVIPQDKT